MSYRLTHETPDALEAINRVLASSITAWQLSDRLYRLSVNAYRYRHSDWIDYQFYGLRNENNTLVAILVVNEEGLLKRLPLNNKASMLARQPIVGNVVMIEPNQIS